MSSIRTYPAIIVLIQVKLSAYKTGMHSSRSTSKLVGAYMENSKKKISCKKYGVRSQKSGSNQSLIVVNQLNKKNLFVYKEHI